MRAVTKNITATTANTTSVSSALSDSMAVSTNTMVSSDENTCGMLCESIWRMASASFVYRLINSPVACVSK